MRNRRVNKFLKGYIPQEKKRFFKPKFVGLDDARYEEFSVEEQNFACQKIIEDKSNICNYVAYLKEKNLFDNLSDENLFDLIEAYSNTGGYFGFEDKEVNYTFTNKGTIVLAMAEKYIPEEKKIDFIKKMFQNLDPQSKLIAYSLVPEKDREQLNEYMDETFDKQTLISNISSLIGETRNPLLNQGNYQSESDWIGKHAEKVLECFKDKLDMNEMDQVFRGFLHVDKRRSILSSDIVGILVRNSKKVSPELLFSYIKDGVCNEEQTDSIVEDNIQRFDFYHHREEHIFNASPEKKIELYEAGKIKKEIFEYIKSLPEEERLEEMKTKKDCLYCEDIIQLLYVIPDEQKEEAYKYFEDHLTDQDKERIFEVVMPKNLQEIRNEKIREEIKNSPSEQLAKLRDMLEELKAEGKSHGGRGSL